MELHQRHFERAGSRSEEFTTGLTPLCNNNSSNQFSPLTEIATHQYAVLDCPINTSSKNVNRVVIQTSNLQELSAISIITTQSDVTHASVEPIGYGKSTEYEAQRCASCSEYLFDRTFLAANSQYWHIKCLRCSHCSTLLEQYPACFFKENIIFCKQCYCRQFGKKCSSCRRFIQPTDWVRKAQNFVYHLACFACDHCKRQLSTGEEFALQDCHLLCKQHYMELLDGDAGQQKSKNKRVRTTFAEEQLAVLQTHFQIDSNPDGADLERIASMTGLSKRVTQVWFQNSRARQKKHQVNKKGMCINSSGRSSIDGCASPKSPSCDSNDDGMMFPTSVLTSIEDTMITNRASMIPRMDLSKQETLILDGL